MSSVAGGDGGCADSITTVTAGGSRVIWALGVGGITRPAWGSRGGCAGTETTAGASSAVACSMACRGVAGRATGRVAGGRAGFSALPGRGVGLGAMIFASLRATLVAILTVLVAAFTEDFAICGAGLDHWARAAAAPAGFFVVGRPTDLLIFRLAMAMIMQQPAMARPRPTFAATRVCGNNERPIKAVRRESVG